MAASVQNPPTAYEKQFRAQLAALVSDSPDWLQELRLKAMSRFEALGFPTRRQEAWKYINLRPLLETGFEPYAHPAQEVPMGDDNQWLSALQGMTGQAGEAVCRLTFVNGRFAARMSSMEALPQGLVVDHLQAACQTHPERIENLLGQYLAEEPDPFFALNTALFEDGALVCVDDGIDPKALVHLVFISTGDNQPRAAYPRNLFVVGKNAKLNVVLHFLGSKERPYFNDAVHEFVLEDGADVQCTAIQNEGPNAWHLGVTKATFGKNARLNYSTISLGGQVCRHSMRVLLQGEGAECRLNGLDVLKGKSEVYHHTVMEHWVPNCVSDQYYKGILDDSARSEFNGLVFVAKNAVGTDSLQMNKNLVLSDNARVWTRPQLQINADDVKCAHGATVGQLEKEQLFYLASRGLDPELAEAVLTYGFAEEIIQRVTHPIVRKFLDARVLRNLYSRDSALVRQMSPATS